MLISAVERGRIAGYGRGDVSVQPSRHGIRFRTWLHIELGNDGTH
jgi:hypothetical protein